MNSGEGVDWDMGACRETEKILSRPGVNHIVGERERESMCEYFSSNMQVLFVHFNMCKKKSK